MAECNVKVISIPINILVEVFHYSEYIRCLVKYDSKFEKIDLKSDDCVDICLPMFLDKDEYCQLFSMMSAKQLGGSKALHAKLAELVLNENCRNYVAALVYLGMGTLLKSVVEASLVVYPENCAKLLSGLVDEYGIDHEECVHALHLLRVTLG